MRPLPQVGANLPLVVKPDHLREDKPGCTAEHIRPVVELAAPWNDPVYVVLTDGERTVNIPVQNAGYNGRVLHLYAEVGSFKVSEPKTLPKPEPLPEVAKLPEGTKVIVTWRYADGHEDESRNDIWLGNIVESFGPSDTCFKPRVDGTLREKAPPGYAQPVRWRLAEVEP